MKRINKHSVKFLLKSIATTSALVFLSINTCFAGHKNYFLKTTVDYGGFGLLYEIVTDDGNGGGGTNQEYAEEALGYHFEKVKHYGNICNKDYDSSTKTNHLTINFNSDRGTPTARAEQYKDLMEGQNDTALVFSFPGLKNQQGYQATSNDYTRASQIGETLVNGLNQAILFMRNNAESDLVSKHSLHLLLGKICYTSELSKIKSFEIVLGEPGTTYKITRADTVSNVSKELIPINGLNYSDYVQIKVESGSYKGNYSYFPWRMAKGYHPGQPLAKYLSANYAKESKANENEYLTWGQLILQAMLFNDVGGVSEQDFATDVQTIIGQGLGSDLTATISSVRSLLGLSSMSELVLNMGSRPANYHMGVMSKDMHNIALTVYTLNLMISLTFIGFMIVKMIHQKMLATTNIVAKTTLMEGIKDLIFVAVMLGFFAPLFETLLELNFLIVRTFSYSSEYMASFTALGNKALSMESMAGFMVSSMFLSIDTYINFVYLVRAITVSFLFAISPIIIVSYLWSPAQKNLVFGFFRELVGNIFMQSFHAITMTFFCAYNMSNMSSIEALASAYCFIPITQLFRQLVLGNSGGFSEKIGGKLAGQMTSTAMGLNKSVVQAKHSKDMFTAQAKAQADIAEAERKGSGWSAVGNTVATIGTSVATSAVAGAVAGSATGPGALFTAGAGAVVGLGAGIIASMHAGNGVEKATAKAMGEIGSLQGMQGDQMIGMGLAELGVGLGVSSYDSSGDRMIASGLGSIQTGAGMKGQAESRMGEGGAYMGEAGGHAMKARGEAQLINTVGNALTDTYKEATKKDRMIRDMKIRDEAQDEYNNTYKEDIQARKQKQMTDDLDNKINHMKNNSDKYQELNNVKAHIDVDATLTQFDDKVLQDKKNEVYQGTKFNNLQNDIELKSNSEYVQKAVTSKVQDSTINLESQLRSLDVNKELIEMVELKGDKINEEVQNKILQANREIKVENNVLNRDIQGEGESRYLKTHKQDVNNLEIQRQNARETASEARKKMNPDNN